MVHSYFASNSTLKISAGHKPWKSGLLVPLKSKSFLSFMIELSGFPGLYSSPKSSRIVSQILSNKNAYFFLHIEKFQNRPGLTKKKLLRELNLNIYAGNTAQIQQIVYSITFTRSVVYSVAHMLSFGSKISHFELGNQKFSFPAEAEFLKIFQNFFWNLGVIISQCINFQPNRT